MVLAFLVAGCCTGIIFFALLLRTLLRITVCSDIRRGKEHVLMHTSEWSGGKKRWIGSV